MEGRINVGPSGERFLTAFHQAEAIGKSTGVVTSVQAAHATPAGAWARVDQRENYAEIFRQLTDGGLDVVFGAGHPLFDSSGEPVEDGVADFQFVGGRETWRALQEGSRNSYVLIDEIEQFQSIAEGRMPVSKVVGIAPVRTTLQYARPQDASKIASSPSFEIMSRAALQVLAQDPEGFFVTIEGGAMDWANHGNNLERFLEEQRDFNLAIARVIDWVETHSSWNETLLVVTADHETGGLWGSDSWVDANQDRRFNISDGDRLVRHAPPRRTEAGTRPDLIYSSGDHTSDLVPLWAIGAGARSMATGARIDKEAKRLWGAAYNWDGKFVDITSVSSAFELGLLEKCRSLP